MLIFVCSTKCRTHSIRPRWPFSSLKITRCPTDTIDEREKLYHGRLEGHLNRRDSDIQNTMNNTWCITLYLLKVLTFDAPLLFIPFTAMNLHKIGEYFHDLSRSACDAFLGNIFVRVYPPPYRIEYLYCYFPAVIRARKKAAIDMPYGWNSVSHLTNPRCRFLVALLKDQ